MIFFQLFYCFYVTAHLFISARSILVTFRPLSMVFCPTCQKSLFFAKNCDFFVIFNTSGASESKILSFSGGGGGGNLQFWTNFHEYTLKITSYHVTELIATVRSEI